MVFFAVADTAQAVVDRMCTSGDLQAQTAEQCRLQYSESGYVRKQLLCVSVWWQHQCMTDANTVSTIHPEMQPAFVREWQQRQPAVQGRQ
jgi:hypothetical protein